MNYKILRNLKSCIATHFVKIFYINIKQLC